VAKDVTMKRVKLFATSSSRINTAVNDTQRFARRMPQKPAASKHGKSSLTQYYKTIYLLHLSFYHFIVISVFCVAILLVK